MIHCFPRKLLSSIWIKEMSRLIREEGLEAMQSDLRKNQRRNQIRTQKRRANVSCVVLVMILMIAVCLCPKQLNIGAKCCSRINLVMAAMDVFQRITVQETVSRKDHLRYVRKTSNWLHGFKHKKEGVKQDSGNGDNKQITTTCTSVQSLSCASTKLGSDVISMYVVPVQIHNPDSN